MAPLPVEPTLQTCHRPQEPKMDIFPNRNQYMQQRKWVEYLQKFNFKITYKPRRENLASNALNRKMQIFAISIISNTMLEEIQKALSQDPYFGGIILSYPNQETHETIKDYSVKDGLLHFKGRLCVLAKLKNQVMKEAHEAPL